MFKPSKKLNATENSNLEILESLAYVAPLSKKRYDEYVALCKKAGRKVKAECL